jgi:adenosylcobinamide-GDP ribazoletransferase
LSPTRQLRLFFTALSYFTRIPCIRWAGSTDDDLNHAARYFPLVGVVVGLIAAVVYWLAGQVWPLELAVLASMVATLWVTGAFHEDGFTDTVDGLGGGWTKEQALAIMKDSRIGTFGAVALFMLLFAKFEALLHVAPALLPSVLVVGHTLSRFAAVLVIHLQDYVREAGKAKPLATRLSTVELAIAGACGLAPLALLPLTLLWALLPVALVWIWFGQKLRHRLGGYTGDCLGAMQQLCEITFYLGVVTWSST